MFLIKQTNKQQAMSNENSKKNSFRQTSIMKTKLPLKINKPSTEHQIKSFTKLPFLKDRKYSSSKNLIARNTCDITTLQEDVKREKLSKITKRVVVTSEDKHQETENDPPIDMKYFFQKRKNAIQPINFAELKKYASCNKLTSFPSIPEIHITNDQSYIHNYNVEPQRQIKSTNSIKLETIQYVKRPKLQRFPLKKMLKSQMSKTINPRKIQSQHSIEIQNQEKNLVVKKKSKLSKDMFDKFDSKTKILVKNPFNRLPKKHSHIAQKFQTIQGLQNLQTQFRLSKIFQDCNDQCEMSLSGKSDLQNLIGYMNM